MSEHSQNLYSDIPFRVRVGVVGAGNLSDKTRLAGQIRQIFAHEILRLYDDESQKEIKQAGKTKLAFSLSTTLGNQAERSAADEILKQPDGKIEVVLPCAKTAFLREFVESSAHQEFEELFKRARRPVALHKRLSSSNWTTGEREENLREMTLETRRHIVNRTDVLLVIHDEKPVDENIENIIGYAKKKQRPVILVTADGISNENPLSLSAKAITGLEAFNSFTLSEQKRNEKVAKTYHKLFVSEVKDGQEIIRGKGVEEKDKQSVKDVLLPFYARADLMANENQNTYKHAGLLVYSFSAAAVAAVALGTLWHKILPWAFGLELLLLLTILIVVVLADRKRSHRNWIEGRFLAERLRAAQFLAACKTEVTPIQVPPHLGATGQTDDWTLMAFNEIWSYLPAMEGCDKNSFSQLKEFISEQWLDDQINYHKDKSGKAHRLSQILEWGGIVIFSCALLAAAAHLIFYLLHHEWLEAPLTFAAIVLPAVGAATGGIRAHREYSRISKRSENMAQNLAGLKERLENITKPDEFELFLREIEEMMLVETQDWLMLMRFAKLETAA